MSQADKYLHQTYSYLALRKAVGWIGILFPFVLVFGAVIIFCEPLIQRSISYYYHTGMRNVFVGVLCAEALFLFFYVGHDKRDDWAGNIAAIFAIGVAWFPTTKVGVDTIGVIHYVCAVGFFLTLAYFSIFLFTLGGEKPSRQKLNRNRIFKICGYLMLACLLAMLIYKLSPAKDSKIPFVYWAETIALIAFGISWLTKGGALYPDKK